MKLLLAKKQHLLDTIKLEKNALKSANRKFEKLHNELRVMKRERDFVYNKYKKKADKQLNLMRKTEILRNQERDFLKRIEAAKLDEPM
jgi:hypothetical protein